MRLIPEAFNERSISWQQDFSNCKPQRFSQLRVRNCPLRMSLMKLLKLPIEYPQPVITQIQFFHSADILRDMIRKIKINNTC